MRGRIRQAALLAEPPFPQRHPCPIRSPENRQAHQRGNQRPVAALAVQPGQRRHPGRWAVLVWQRIEPVPKPLDQALGQARAVRDRSKAARAHLRFDQPCNDFEVLGRGLGDRDGQGGDLTPFRRRVSGSFTR